MARKSRKVDYVNVGNKENLVTEAENQCEKVSHAALYARLSYESEKNRERNTIETQMVLLHNFVKEQKDIVVAKEYYDISKTGTNFERDGFNEMMQDIKGQVFLYPVSHHQTGKADRSVRRAEKQPHSQTDSHLSICLLLSAFH